MLNIIERELDAGDRAGSMKKQSTDLPSAATLLSKDSIPNCLYWDQSHSLSQCKAVKDVRKRKQMLLKSGCCCVCRRVILQRTVALP